MKKAIKKLYFMLMLNLNEKDKFQNEIRQEIIKNLLPDFFLFWPEKEKACKSKKKLLCAYFISGRKERERWQESTKDCAMKTEK